MSLINEALKKAQAERPSTIHNHPTMQESERHQSPPTQPRKRRYLFGFLVSVLVVGLFSAALSTYFVYKIIGEEESTAARPAQAGPTPAVVEQAALASEPASVPEPATPVAQVDTAPVVTAPVPAETPQPVVAKTPPTPAPLEKPAPLGDGQSYPEIWTRIQELEIRGIMSGGYRVLIYDTRTSRAKAYRPGDLVDGALSLSIDSISTSEINFRNNDGIRFPKAF
ncbi:MAG: hypothetical protein ACO3ZW_03875 [Opitutales bacterium]